MKPILPLSKVYTPAKILFFAGAFACLVFVGAAHADEGSRDSGASGGIGAEIDVPQARDSGASGGIGGVEAAPEASFQDLGKCERDRHPDHPGSCQIRQ